MPLFAKLSGCISRASARLSACVVLLACLLSGAVIAAAPAPVAEGVGYRYYAIGDLDAARPGPVEPGLPLVGGAHRPLDAFRSIIARAGPGHLLVLPASEIASAPCW